VKGHLIEIPLHFRLGLFYWEDPEGFCGIGIYACDILFGENKYTVKHIPVRSSESASLKVNVDDAVSIVLSCH
jgi:hypothetical protein